MKGTLIFRKYGQLHLHSSHVLCSHLQEAMKIMGLPNWLHWTAWFIKTFMFVMISVILIVLLMKVPWYPGTDLTVFSYSDPTLLLVYFILYMTASICFCFLISVLFSKGNSLHVIIVADVHSCVLLLCLSSLT